MQERFGLQKKYSENLGSIIFRTMANMNCDGWTLFYRISWYSSILSRRLRRHCSLTVQSFHRDFIWTKNRECHFLILKECTRNFCANNVNQMHKGNFINYRRHSSLHWSGTSVIMAKIYDYALIDSFWGSSGFIDSPTGFATLSINKLRYHHKCSYFGDETQTLSLLCPSQYLNNWCQEYL